MRLNTSCELAFDIVVPTPFVLMLRPRSGAQQWVAREEYRLDPSVPAFEFIDGYGNLCQRLVAAPGPFRVRTSAELEVPDGLDEDPGAPFVEVQHLPDPVLVYLLPSRYCETERFWQLAMEITDTFDATQPALRPAYVALGYGRDAADVALYTQFGPPVLPVYQWVQVERLG